MKDGPIHGIDLSETVGASYENKWVALTPGYGRVIASANTLRDLMTSVTDTDAIYHRVLPLDVSFAPTIA